LRLVIQPVVDLASGRVTKVEALARLQSSEGRLIAPGVFLPALGQTDLAVLFRQGLAQSLAALRTWRQDGLDLTLSLNLDPITLVEPDCPLWVERALREADLPPAALTLELLETQEIDARMVDEAMLRLHALGVRLSMDDLGSGYSSMKRLVNLPFDVIKIDQDVVKDVQSHPLQGIALMRTVLQMGQDLDCVVVAEGLEDAALVEVAQILGCTLGQGYGLARPMPIDTFPEWMRAHTPLPLPSGADLHSWLGATAYAWMTRHERHTFKSSLAACPVTRFFARQAVQDPQALRWHALMHESAFEQERKEATDALLQWMEQQVLKEKEVKEVKEATP
jgi:EAL domain-containing protein (putative c-di-GMP-specific phosphodiesterase class I)